MSKILSVKITHINFAIKNGNSINVNYETLSIKNFIDKYKGMYLNKCARALVPLIKIQTLKDLEKMQENMYYSIATKQTCISKYESEYIKYNSLLTEEILYFY